jgi:hypothetical protein
VVDVEVARDLDGFAQLQLARDDLLRQLVGDERGEGDRD